MSANLLCRASCFEELREGTNLMSGLTKWSELRDELRSKPSAQEVIDQARRGSAEELRLYELRHGEAVSQVELAGRLEVPKGRSPSSSTPTMYASRCCVSISKRWAPAWSWLRCSTTTRSAGCRSTSVGSRLSEKCLSADLSAHHRPLTTNCGILDHTRYPAKSVLSCTNAHRSTRINTK